MALLVARHGTAGRISFAALQEVVRTDAGHLADRLVALLAAWAGLFGFDGCFVTLVGGARLFVENFAKSLQVRGVSGEELRSWDSWCVELRPGLSENDASLLLNISWL